jgi:hydroxymethylpyrimidine pyrophosphatase-like HAD family hydrolase
MRFYLCHKKRGEEMKGFAPVKAVVVDLDGTLLRGDKTISARTLDTLSRCRASGIKLAYATARGGSASRVAPDAYFDGRIRMGGAVAYIGDELIYDRFIPWATARPFLLASHARGLKTASEVSGMHYANFNVHAEWPYITQY